MRTCDDPLESFNPSYSFTRTTRKAHQCRSLPVQIGLFHCAYCVHVLVNLENRQTHIKLKFAYLKHSLLVGVRRCLDCLGLSLHPFKN